MATDKDRLIELSAKPYKEQAEWFLNAYWIKDLDLGKKPEELEKIWNYTQTCVQLDTKKGEEGNELDEFNAHRFLEKVDKALTVKKMRETFREIDLDFNGKVSLTEFLIYKYSVDYTYLVNAPQGSAEVLQQLEAAEAKVTAAQESVEDCKVKEAAAQEKLKEQKQAEAEVKEALEAIHAEQRKLDAEREAFEAKANDESLGVVKRNRAKAELAQWKAQDHEAGVRRAKIDQEAAVRKQEKATRAADSAKIEAEKARERSEEMFQDAKEFLEELKTKSTAGQGKLWWMERELDESKKFMSKKQRQKVEAEQRARKERLEREMGL